MLAGAVVLITLLVVAVDVSPDYGHLDAPLFTGAAEGNYHALAGRLGEAAKSKGGKIAAITTQGSVDNLDKLAAGCEADFALVQDGIAPPEGSDIELIARLTGSEALFVLGKDAARFEQLRQLEGLTIGVGPAKSGSDRLAREVFGGAGFQALDLELVNGDVAEQLAGAAAGSLDLAALVVDVDAALVADALRGGGLQMASFEHLPSVARQLRHVTSGVIAAGHFDPIAVVPSRDRQVLLVDTLLVGNGCASHAEEVAILTLLKDEMPGLVEHNQRRGKSLHYVLASSAKSFFDNDGPDVFEMHVPWLVDIMPPSKWVYIVTAISVLFNLMGTGHRFRLWRIDTHRIKTEADLRELLGQGLTIEELRELSPDDKHLTDAVLKGVDDVLRSLTELRERCRKQSVSMLVPMGQEMAYRYQEDQIEQELTALRLFRARLAKVVTA